MQHESSDSNNNKTHMTLSFPLIVSATSLAIAFIVVLVLLLVNIRSGDVAREKLLTRVISETSAMASESIERTVNVSVARVRSNGAALHNIDKSFGMSSPYMRNSSSSSGWSLAGVNRQVTKRVLTIQVEQVYIGGINPRQSTLTLRWADGTGGRFTASTADQDCGIELYRETYGGIWRGVNGPSLPSIPSGYINEMYNRTTFQPTSKKLRHFSFNRHLGAQGSNWNNSLVMSGYMAKPASWQRAPMFFAAARQPASWYYGMEVMIFDRDTGRPALLNFAVLSGIQFAHQLRQHLVQFRVAPNHEGNISHAFLVDRAQGVILSQSNGRNTFVESTIEGDVGGPNVRVSKRCWTGPSGSSVVPVGCFKNVSDTPDYVLLRDLLLAGGSTWADLDDALASSNPMLSDPDRGGDLALNIITGSDDGVEYYAVARTLALPADQYLKLSIIAFTPRDLFAGEAIRARDTAIGISVAVAFVVVIVQALVLYSVGSSVSELAEQMSNPLARLRTTPINSPSVSSSLGDAGRRKSPISAADQTSNRSFRARVLRALSSLSEIRSMQESFDLCIGKVKELRGFVSRRNVAFLVGLDASGGSTDGSGSTLKTKSGGISTQEVARPAAAAAAGRDVALGGDTSHDESEAQEHDELQPARGTRKRVRFEEPQDQQQATVTEKNNSNGKRNNERRVTVDADDDSGESITAAAEAIPSSSTSTPRYPIEIQRSQNKHQRFCAMSISFPFVRALLNRVAEVDENASSAARTFHNAVLFDAVNLAAKAAHIIFARTHATSIEEMNCCGDETLLCFRLRSRGLRSKFLLRFLHQCVAMSFKLLHATSHMTRFHLKQYKEASKEQTSLQFRLRLMQFVAAGLASSEARAVEHDASSVTNRVSVVGAAVAQSHYVQRTMREHCGSLIWDHQEFNLLVRDCPSVRREMRGKQQQQGGDERPAAAGPNGSRSQFLIAVPFLIGVTRPLIRTVEPDFSPVRSFLSPERRRRQLEGQDGFDGAIWTDDDVCLQLAKTQKQSAHGDAEVLRVAPVEMTNSLNSAAAEGDVDGDMLWKKPGEETG